MFSFAQAGADIQFVLTGSRSGTQPTSEPHLEQIDVTRLERITEMLESAAQKAGKRWAAKKLTAVAAEVYNALSTDEALSEPQLERVLRLVVNR